MRLVRTILGVFIPSILAGEILHANEATYYHCRAKYPGLNEHDYLAMTYAARKRSGRAVGLDSVSEEHLDVISQTETQQFAVLVSPDSIRALALYILYKERPNLIRARHHQEFDKLVKPIHKAQDDGTFDEWYARTNPNK